MIIQVYIYIRTTLLSCLRATRTSWIMSWKRHKLKWATFWTWGFTFLSHIRTPHQTSPNITKPCQIWVYCTQTGFCQNEMIGCLGGSFLCHKKHPKTLSTCSLTRMREASRRTSTPRSSLARWPFQLWLPKVSWKFNLTANGPIQSYSDLFSGIPAFQWLELNMGSTLDSQLEPGRNEIFSVSFTNPSSDSLHSCHRVKKCQEYKKLV